MPKIPLLLDVDTGVDDAIAIALACNLDRHQLIGVTTVAGNVPIEHATHNTLRVLDWLGSDAPVYRGMSQPLARPLYTARDVHGDEGLGGWQAPTGDRAIEPETAPEAIVRLARERQGEIAFGCVGPLTNLAVALMLEPRIVDWVARLVIMGGAFRQPGNTTPDAEFNIFVDPEAAAIVARAGFNATWIGLDVTHHALLDASAWRDLAGADAPNAELVREVCRFSFEGRAKSAVHLHDPLAVAVIEQPDLVETVSGTVHVEVGGHAPGMTRVVEPVLGAHAQEVAVQLDAARFDAFFGGLVT